MEHSFNGETYESLTQDIISESFGVARRSVWQFLKYLLTCAVVFVMVIIVLSLTLGAGSRLYNFVIEIVLLLLQAGFAISFISYMVKLSIEDRISIRDPLLKLKPFEGFQKKNLRKLLMLFLGNSVRWLGIMLGFLFFIIPGIYIAVRWSFWDYYIIDEDISCLNALKKSWTLTKGKFWKVFWLEIKLFLLNVLGSLLFVIWVFWTIPTNFIAMSRMWIALKMEKGELGSPIANEVNTL